MMHWYGPGMGPWGYGLMGVTMVLFWALVLAAVAVLVRMLVRGRAAHHDGSTPERVLAERFARGEIDEQEYRHRLDVLHGRAPGGGG
ncbi:SHOCT domain-containing protein [Actinocatenispora rupis]|uniref:SHOCT domain-containing protein n=1 Tax=Actinocatenispora rupis TaxID=519421 RepID=A0A8J3NDP9_9ACTN|nr:SHOCT domain-containing protein [Actinocatenispora rupis]GID15529.1 hypothetical protein Aru02nite_64180 [Actinocatenispora rupis]